MSKRAISNRKRIPCITNHDIVFYFHWIIRNLSITRRHTRYLPIYGSNQYPSCILRNRIPIIVDNVTTLVGPGELIDVIVTERGIAINPKREDLIKATKKSGLPIRKIEEIKEEVDELVGAPLDKPKFTNDVVGVVKWVDGTVIDSIFKIKQ